MQTLSYGIKKPTSGDRGSEWFPALEENIQRQNDHDHDGVDSAQILSTNIAPVQQPLSSENWSHVSNGIYRQLVAIPNGKLFDNSIIVFRDASDRGQLMLEVLKVTSTSYYVFCNDSSINLIAYYVS